MLGRGGKRAETISQSRFRGWGGEERAFPFPPLLLVIDDFPVSGALSRFYDHESRVHERRNTLKLEVHRGKPPRGGGAPFPLHANAGPAPNDDANAVGAKSSATILLSTPPLPFSPFSSFEILLLFFSSSSDSEDNGRRRGKSIRMQTRIVSLGDVETLGGSSFI